MGTPSADTSHVQDFESLPFPFCAVTVTVCGPGVAELLVYDDSVTDVVPVIFVERGVLSKDHVIFEGWLIVAVNVLDSPTLFVTLESEGLDKVITGMFDPPVTLQVLLSPVD